MYVSAYLDTPFLQTLYLCVCLFYQARHAGSERRTARGKKQANGTAGQWSVPFYIHLYLPPGYILPYIRVQKLQNFGVIDCWEMSFLHRRKCRVWRWSINSHTDCDCGGCLTLCHAGTHTATANQMNIFLMWNRDGEDKRVLLLLTRKQGLNYKVYLDKGLCSCTGLKKLDPRDFNWCAVKIFTYLNAGNHKYWLWVGYALFQIYVLLCYVQLFTFINSYRIYCTSNINIINASVEHVIYAAVNSRKYYDVFSKHL